jgi:membrane-bound metal-dependent hydrolase YbcI (DUF457 family)
MALGTALTWFWLYSFRLIYVNANPKGDGREWVAAIPFALIFFALVVPAIRLSSNQQRIPLAAALAVAALVLNVLLTIEIARESVNPLRF